MSSTLLLPPLVGRDQELRSLGGLMERALAQKGAVVFVGGEAGVGKSRLCEEFGKVAAEKGCEVIVGRCVPGAPTPYLPFQDALENYFSSKDGAKPGSETSRRQRIAESAKRAAPELVEAVPVVGSILKATAAFFKEYREIDLNPESDSERTLHATLEFLRKMSAKHLIVMVLEDLHWADSPSVQLLHFLARNSRDLRVLLIGTYRPEDIAAGPSGMVHPFLDSLRIMRREHVCEEIKLDRLNLEELRLAIEGMLGGSVSPELLREVASESGGNPLFAVEAVRLLNQSRSIVLREGEWKPTGTLPLNVPSSVKEVILRRIERLPAEQRRVLDCASVIGLSFEPAIIGTALRLELLSVLEILDSIGRTAQLVSPVDGLYSFSHEKVQRTIGEEISSPRRRELHRTVAHALEGQMPDESLYGQLSSHFLAAGDKAKCIHYSLLAGKSSLKRFGNAEAIGYFERVLQLTRDDPSLVEVRLQALEGIGDAHKATGLDESATKHYESFLKLCSVPGERARVLRKSAECLLLSNTGRAMELLEQAEKCGGIERVEYGRVTKLRGSYAVISGALDQAQSYFSEAQEVFSKTDSTEDLAKLSVSVSDLHLSRGSTRQALESAEEAIELFSKLQSPMGEATASFQLGNVYWNGGVFEEAVDCYNRAIRALTEFGRYRALAEVYEYKAGMQYGIGDIEPSRADALKAHDFALMADSAYWQAHACFMLAIIEIHLNRVAEGEKWYRKGSELLKSLGKLADMRSPLPIWGMIAEAHLLDAKGDWTASKEKFLRSIELYQGTYWGVLHEGIARTQFGMSAKAHGYTAEAREQFRKAVEIYEKLGNTPELQKLNKLLEENTHNLSAK